MKLWYRYCKGYCRYVRIQHTKSGNKIHATCLGSIGATRRRMVQIQRKTCVDSLLSQTLPRTQCFTSVTTAAIGQCHEQTHGLYQEKWCGFWCIYRVWNESTEYGITFDKYMAWHLCVCYVIERIGHTSAHTPIRWWLIRSIAAGTCSASAKFPGDEGGGTVLGLRNGPCLPIKGTGVSFNLERFMYQ